MAGKRFEIVDSPYNVIPTRTFRVASGGGVLEVGMFCKDSAAGSPFVVPSVTADHTISTDMPIAGLVAKDSTHTSGDNGVVEVYAPLEGIIYRGFATTGANVDTQTKIDDLLGDRVDITVSATTSAGDWSLNEDQGDTKSLAFRIVGGDKDKETVDFTLRQAATIFGDDVIA